MSDPENAPSPEGVLTLSDAAFYEEELRVLEALHTKLGQQTIADVCRDHQIDQYDFKDRWGSLLRHNEPLEVLAKIKNVREMLGGDIGYIAKKLGYTQSCVRTIVKKLLEKPGDDHKRTKVNLAHRMMPLCGGSLKKAQAKLHCRRKTRKSSTDDESDSDSDEDSDDSDEDYGTRLRKSHVRVEKVSGAKVKTEAPKPAPPRQEVLFETTAALIDDPDPRFLEDSRDYISPKLQVRVLADSRELADLQKTCVTHDVDFTMMSRIWKPLIDAFTRQQLEAFLYSLVVLHRLGYGYSIIADALEAQRAYVVTAMRNLRLFLSPHHGRSFDVTVLLVRKEVMTSSRIAETCGIPKEVARLIIKRCGQREKLLTALQSALDEVAIAQKVLWLFERGLSVSAICTVLKVSEKLVASACPDDASSNGHSVSLQLD